MGTRDPARHRFTFADDLMQVSLLIASEVNQVFVDHGVLYGRLPFAKDDVGVLEQIGCKFYIRPVVQADACWP